MKRLISYTILLSVVFMYGCSDDDDKDDQHNTPVAKYETIEIETSKGNIYLWLYDETPLHKANFLKLTKEGYYDSVIFHRVIRDFMIQTGDPTGVGNGGPGYTIEAEFDSGLIHVKGAVGAARTNNPEKRSSGSQFYIVQNKNGSHHLDMNYTVFGMTMSGLDVVDAIANVQTSGSNRPLENVYMLDVHVVEYSKAELLSKFGFTIPE